MARYIFTDEAEVREFCEIHRISEEDMNRLDRTFYAANIYPSLYDLERILDNFDIETVIEEINYSEEVYEYMLMGWEHADDRKVTSFISDLNMTPNQYDVLIRYFEDEDGHDGIRNALAHNYINGDKDILINLCRENAHLVPYLASHDPVEYLHENLSSYSEESDFADILEEIFPGIWQSVENLARFDEDELDCYRRILGLDSESDE